MNRIEKYKKRFIKKLIKVLGYNLSHFEGITKEMRESSMKIFSQNVGNAGPEVLEVIKAHL